MPKIAAPLETTIQSAFVRWCRLAETRLPRLRLGFAVPNGGYRSPTTAARLKDEGVRAGVPDWLLPVASAGFNGLAIEFKRPKGKASPEQVAYMDLLVKEDWLVVVCTDHEAAARTVDDYLRG